MSQAGFFRGEEAQALQSQPNSGVGLSGRLCWRGQLQRIMSQHGPIDCVALDRMLLDVIEHAAEISHRIIGHGALASERLIIAPQDYSNAAR
jgi:hypothetical protein